MTNTNNTRHYSAYRGELGKYFNLQSGKIFLDLTLGDGGHTEEALIAGCKVISFDIDQESINRSISFLKNIAKPIVIDSDDQRNNLENFRWIIFKTNFVNAKKTLVQHEIGNVDNIMIDLGPSQNQVLTEDRGFSFNSTAMLDMRIDPALSVTAKDLINVLNEGELRQLFELADESYAKPIARVIATLRKEKPITTCSQLSEIIVRIKGKKTIGIHPATKVFMALRMAVNSERENIKEIINQIPDLLNKDGIAGVISFHSGEDKVVKECFKKLIEEKKVFAINKKPITPNAEELAVSNRTRSAKLRLIKK